MFRSLFLCGSLLVAGILVLASCQNPFTSDYESRIAAVDSIAAPDGAGGTDSIAVLTRVIQIL